MMETVWRWEGFLLLLLTSHICRGAPVVSTAISHAVDFLTKYGYLPLSDLETGNLRTEKQLQKAIKTMQKFANIPETGSIDDTTLSLMKSKRCGMPDLIELSDRLKRYALQGQKWPKSNLTWSIKDAAPNSNLSIVRNQLSKAFKIWSDASRLTFQEVYNQDADIVVSFPRGSHGDGYPFDGEGSVLAHAFFPGEGIGGDAHFDAEEKWVPTEPLIDDDGVNLFAVAAHEFGHSLGLSHSSVPDSLMFPYYQALEDGYKLPADDTAGIRQLYGVVTSPLNPHLSTEQPFTSQVYTDISPTEKTSSVQPSQNPSSGEEIPNTCDITFDAVAVIRREVFVFKGKYFWRLDSSGVKRNYPVPIDRFWYNLPVDIERIDAVYERPTDKKIVFFIGKHFWVFTANQAERGYPKPLSDLGLPNQLERIDAAVVWGHNGKTYLFSGTQYWRLDESEQKVELDYPRDMGLWRGIPYYLDAAFQWIDGNTYFFKGRYFWKFHDVKMRVHDNMPAHINEFWFGCSSSYSEKSPQSNPSIKDIDYQVHFNQAAKLSHSLLSVVLASILLLFYN